MKHPPFAPLFAALLMVFTLHIPAESKQPGGGSHVSVTISPLTSQVSTGQTQQFTTSVSGTKYKSVTWSVNGVIGGNATVGTVSTAGLYTAPTSTPTNPIQVTAASTYQPSAYATASVSISSGTPVAVSVSPTSTTVPLAGTAQFSANISGTSNTAVNWEVNGIAGGSSALGTISSVGVYTAPGSMPSSAVVVTAQSVAQPSASANASVQLTAPTVSVSISPLNANVMEGSTQQFSAQISGTSYTSVNWLVSGIAGGNSSVGTVTAAGLYTAPATIPSVAVVVTAQSAAYPTDAASAYVTVQAPVVHSVNLSWNAETSVAGYNLYRSTQQSGPFTKLNPSLETATVYSDSNVTSGQTYYYAATAVDSNGVESTYSNIAQATIP
jgi:hypothetical protein